jgi:ElaB/YqjD/DUF883 family membrane-anchored ribosome-binding protein
MRNKTGNGHNASVEQFLEDIKTVVHDGEELLKAGAIGVKTRALAGFKTTTQRVREHPMQTIGLVFVAGIVVGLLAAGAFGGEED